MKPRAELHQSAPITRARMMSKALTILPATPIRIWSRKPTPTRELWTKRKPSRIGIPILSTNSTGAAPVPPSLPSTTIKSGYILLSNIAFTIANQSAILPMQSLKPTGLPFDKLRSSWIKRHNSKGDLKAEWLAGDMQSSPKGTPRVSAISGVTLDAGNTPPWPGFAPWDNLISIILIWGSSATVLKRSGSKRPSCVRQPK